MLWAVLQFALPAAATYADARLEREGASAQGPHAESQSEASCRPVHPTECALCQLVSRTSTPAVQDAGAPEIVIAIEQARVGEGPWRALSGTSRLALARAPPLG
jgi:hypothetical protein